MTTTAPPSKDGQAVHIEEMIDAMRTLWHEVRVVAPTQRSAWPQWAAVGKQVVAERYALEHMQSQWQSLFDGG